MKTLLEISSRRGDWRSIGSALRMIWSVGMCLVVILAEPVEGGVPELLSFQGSVSLGDDGAPSQEVTLRFSLYEGSRPQEGEILLWAEERTVTINNGVFHVMLGDSGGTPVAGAKLNNLGYAIGAGAKYVETTVVSGVGVNGPIVLLPRRRFEVVPTALHVLNGVPTGSIMPFAGMKVPDGWMPCDGQMLSRIDPEFVALYEAIGVRFGADGSDGFRLPDLSGRLPIGVGDGTSTSPRILTEKPGSATHTLKADEMASHTHPPLVEDHAHRLRSPSSNLVDASNAIGWEFVISYQGGASDPNNQRKTSPEKCNLVEDVAGNANPTPFSLSQPSMAIPFIIKK